MAEIHGSGKKYWRYPSALPDYTLSLYEYDSWLGECEHDEATMIKNRVGTDPSAILCIELRRSTQDISCDDAEFIVFNLLEKYVGIVDDSNERCWALRQIKEGGFLDEYRSKQ